MHSNAQKMLSEIGYALPFGSGVIAIYGHPVVALRSRVSRPAVPCHSFGNLLIHSFINQTHSL